MRRSFNYTHRRRINRTRVHVRLLNGEPAQTFDATLDLGGLGLPEDGEVFVEAYYRTRFMRFPFGRVDALAPPADRRLTEFPGEGTVFFRVRVVQADGGERGRLLALADAVRPEFADERSGEEGEIGATRKQPILPVKHEDLRDQVWRLAFEEPHPVLEVNKRIPAIDDLLRRDPRFFAFVYPEVIRQVLTRILIVERRDASDVDSLDDWQRNWVQFARALFPDSLPEMENPDDARPQLDEWINGVVHRFCSVYNVRQRLMEAIEA